MKPIVSTVEVTTFVGLGLAVLCLMLFSPGLSRLSGESEAGVIPTPVFYLPTLINVAPLGVIFTHDFETGDLTGWTLRDRDTAFPNQPTFDDNSTARKEKGIVEPRAANPSEHEGDWWVSSFERYQGINDSFLKTGKGKAQEPGDFQGSARQGSIRSIEFEIVGDAIDFLVGGNERPWNPIDPQEPGFGATAVNLEIGGEMVMTAAGGIGNQTLPLQRVQWDVSKLKGKMATVVVYDKDSGGWTAFDDVNQLKKGGEEFDWNQLLAVDAFGKLPTTFGRIKSKH